MFSDVSPFKIQFMAAIKPEVTIAKDGKTYVQTNVTPWKTTTSRMTPGEIMEADIFNSGTTSKASFLYLKEWYK